MLVLCKVKFKWIVEFFFWLILLGAFAMGIFAISQKKTEQPGQVNIPLYSVEQIQTELNARGYEIAIDGIYGPETELALETELMEMRKIK